MYTRKIVIYVEGGAYKIGVLEQNPADAYIGAEGWLTPLPAGVDINSDAEWFTFMETYEGISYDGGYAFTYNEADGLYYLWEEV